MKIILSILLLAFCSCTSSGKLTDAKFPYSLGLVTYGTKLSAEKINATASPTNVGSYTVTASISDRNYYGEKFKTKQDTIKLVLLYVAIGLSILLLIFLLNRKRDEEIAMPDDEDDKFPPFDNAFGINNSIFKL